MRTAFGTWSGFEAYSTSSTEMTGTEALQNEEVQGAAKSGFFFAETAIVNASTGDPQSIALLLSLGGIPGGKSGKDATLTDLKGAPKATAESWKNTAKSIKEKATNVKEAAKEFREKLKSQKKGKVHMKKEVLK